MKRHLPDILAVLSLLLCITVAAIGIRSYWVGDRYYRSRWRVDGLRTQESASWFLIGSGKIGIAHRSQVMAAQRAENIDKFKALAARPVSRWLCDRPPATNWHPPDDGTLLHRLGFWAIDAPMPPGTVVGYYREWGMPLWPICLALTLWPAWCYAQYRRRHSRNKRGLCPVCGYDLRATPDRCPECGTQIPVRERP